MILKKQQHLVIETIYIMFFEGFLGVNKRKTIGPVTAGSTYTIEGAFNEIYLVYASTNGIFAMLKRYGDADVEVMMKGYRWDDFVQPTAMSGENSITLTFLQNITTGMQYIRIA